MELIESRQVESTHTSTTMTTDIEILALFWDYPVPYETAEERLMSAMGHLYYVDHEGLTLDQLELVKELEERFYTTFIPLYQTLLAKSRLRTTTRTESLREIIDQESLHAFKEKLIIVHVLYASIMGFRSALAQIQNPYVQTFVKFVETEMFPSPAEPTDDDLPPIYRGRLDDFFIPECFSDDESDDES